jgi:hypothetical protein
MMKGLPCRARCPRSAGFGGMGWTRPPAELEYTLKAARSATSSTIDLHHGTYSANLPYTVLDVIGTAITARLKAELGEYGFGNFQETARGFRAVRTVPDGPA